MTARRVAYFSRTDDARCFDRAARELLCACIRDGIHNLRRLADGDPPTYSLYPHSLRLKFAKCEIEWATRPDGDAFNSLEAGLRALDLPVEAVQREIEPLIRRIKERGL